MTNKAQNEEVEKNEQELAEEQTSSSSVLDGLSEEEIKEIASNNDDGGEGK
ncbi:hypothetical protein V6R21_01700 [Limibacter armeniacum]|uniref:hypothetical protein n=1 Tax=Limibacter armeniacum TaxID=466084 RepID=UPI002FE566EF